MAYACVYVGVCTCLCMCVHVHLYACTHIQVLEHVYVCVYRCQKPTLNMCFSHSLSYISWDVLSLSPKPTGSEKWLESASGVCRCLPTWCRGHTCIAALIAALCSASGELNSGLCAYTTSTLPTQLPPSPSFILNVWFTDVKYSLPQFPELSSFVL